MRKKAKRMTWHVTPDKGSEKDWRVKRRGASRASRVFANKERAIACAKRFAKKRSRGQVLVHNKKGRIVDEMTYGDDPRGSRG